MSEPPKKRRSGNPRIALLADRRNERLTRVAALYVTGRFTMKEMAQRCGEVTVRQIQRDIRHIREIWTKAASQDVKVYLSECLAKIDKLEAEAWQAWFESRQLQTEKLRQTETDPDGEVTVKRARRTKKAVGEAIFLQTILACVDRRIRLFGLEDRLAGGADDIQVHAVEVICDSREQAMAMIEFEDFRTIIKR